MSKINEMIGWQRVLVVRKKEVEMFAIRVIMNEKSVRDNFKDKEKTFSNDGDQKVAIKLVKEQHGEVIVTKHVLIYYLIEKYKDEVLYDMVSMHTSYLLLRKPWQFNRKAIHNGLRNRYNLKKDGRICILALLSPKEVYEDQLKLKRKWEVEMII